MAARSRFGAPRAAIQGAIVVLSLVCLFPASTQAYDALDPLGNITIVWDVSKFLGDGYEATVHIWNNQYFKKVEEPGWALRWNWTKGEMIWAISGAEATEKGDCPARGLPTPGGKDPHKLKIFLCQAGRTLALLLEGQGKCVGAVAADCILLPFVASVSREGNGVLTRSRAKAPTQAAGSWAAVTLGTHARSSHLTVGNASSTPYDLVPPANFTRAGGRAGGQAQEALTLEGLHMLNLEGYTCTPPIRVEPSVVNTDGRRNTQCCVSLSAFYNDTIIPCTNCACACGNFSSSADICTSANSPFLVQTGEDGRSTKPLTSMECSPDGCPISVHYHVKVNYELYWRAKVTIVNRNLYKNYTDWNVVLEVCICALSVSRKHAHARSLANAPTNCWPAHSLLTHSHLLSLCLRLPLCILSLGLCLSLSPSASASVPPSASAFFSCSGSASASTSTSVSASTSASASASVSASLSASTSAFLSAPTPAFAFVSASASAPLSSHLAVQSRLAQHPAFNNFTEVYSWEGRQFQPFGVNNSAVFWGMAEYNDVLMPAGPKGNVQSEMLFAKDSAFTFSNGWAFPRRVVFNGEECILPEVFPTLPSGTLRVQAPIPLIVGAAVALMVLLLSF
eukprot:jgi/Mesen1/8767/ME000524S08061